MERVVLGIRTHECRLAVGVHRAEHVVIGDEVVVAERFGGGGEAAHRIRAATKFDLGIHDTNLHRATVRIRCMPMKRFLTTAAVVALAGVAFAGCGGNDKKDTASGSGDTTATTAASGGTTLTLVATNFKFDKTTLTATAGESVTFVVKNEADSTEHNLSIEDLKVNKDVEAGESAQQTVSDLKAGTYEYHCEYHPSQMTGTLTVS